jgi:hypothetical protein
LLFSARWGLRLARVVEVTEARTDADRKQLHPKRVRPSKPFAPTIKKVKEIVPAKVIPKEKPTPPRPPLH